MSRLMRITAAAALLGAPALLIGGVASAQDDYSVAPLEQLTGSTGACASAINEHGVSAGYDYTTESHAVYWDAAFNITDIGTLPGGTESGANDINEDGDIVGASGVTGGDVHAFFYDVSTTTMVDIHPPAADPNTDSEANGLNDSGFVVGEMEVGGNTHGFLYDPTGPTWTDLGTLGGLTSSAGGINNAGFVGGYSNVAGGDRHVFLWDPGTMTMSDLGTNGGPEALSFDINATNEQAGWSDQAGGPPIPKNGFLYSGGFNTLTAPPPMNRGQALSLNDGGDAIGSTWENGVNDFIPTLWPSGGQAVALPTLGGAGGSGDAINNAGVGAGCAEDADGTSRAVLWLPPVEPPPTPTTTTTTTPAAAVTPKFTG